MAIYTDQMFNLSGAAVTSLTAMNFGTGTVAGNYSPQLNGTLQKIAITLVPQAASSLAQYGQVELSQTNWRPNILRFVVAGFGLATAPQLYGGTQATTEFLVQQTVQTDWPITGQVVYRGTGPVTPTVHVLGFFTG
jgi:hypothetical protein